jgi:hypothetical protein
MPPYNSHIGTTAELIYVWELKFSGPELWRVPGTGGSLSDGNVSSRRAVAYIGTFGRCFTFIFVSAGSPGGLEVLNRIAIERLPQLLRQAMARGVFRPLAYTSMLLIGTRGWFLCAFPRSSSLGHNAKKNARQRGVKRKHDARNNVGKTALVPGRMTHWLQLLPQNLKIVKWLRLATALGSPPRSRLSRVIFALL